MPPFRLAPFPSSSFCAVPMFALALLAGCGRSEPDPRTEPPLVRVATASAGTDGSRQFTGVIASRVQSDLGFRVGGKVVERLVDAGQTVRRGQILMRLDRTDLALASSAQSGTVQSTAATAGQAIAEERRYRDLVAAGAVSALVYDQAKARADAARAQLSAAQAQARTARNAEGYSVLRADADGTVIETLAEPGQVVNAAQTVVRVARAGPREAVVSLPETVRPRIGSLAEATLYGSPGTSQARLRQLSDAADPQSRTFEGRYVLIGPASSAPLGATVTLSLSAAGGSSSQRVPLAALSDTGRGPGVWVLPPGSRQISFRRVRLGAIGAETVEILDGLRPGERFVALGAHLLHQGQEVRPMAARPFAR